MDESNSIQNKERTVKAKDCGPKIANVSRTRILLDDFVQLDIVHESAIIHLLRNRYSKDRIYTSIGDILVAVNPFKATNDFSEANMDAYRKRGK